MRNIFLETNNLYLEPLEEQHLSDNYIFWLNNSEITQYNSHGIFPNTKETTLGYIQNCQNRTQIVLAIIDKQTNQHIGNTAISKIDYINSHADISILLGEKKFWGKGYAVEVFRAILSHCFNKLNLNKINSGTTSDNIPMQKVFKKLNFTQEGLLREYFQRDGRFVDIVPFGILKREFIDG
jgi:RimJ/RimL family protein N-acetyltransferase